MKKRKVVAGKKLTCLSFEILKIGRPEAEIRPSKEVVKNPGMTRVALTAGDKQVSQCLSESDEIRPF